MAIRLNKSLFKLEGECDECGAPLCCITIENGTPVCSNAECETEATFDPSRFAESLKEDKQ